MKSVLLKCIQSTRDQQVEIEIVMNGNNDYARDNETWHRVSASDIHLQNRHVANLHSTFKEVIQI